MSIFSPQTTDQERYRLFQAFVKHAPYFSDDDWAALDPAWRVAWEAVQDLSKRRIRPSRRYQCILPARLGGVNQAGVLEAVHALGRWANKLDKEK